MSKPDDIPQDVWDASVKALWTDAMHEGECPEWMETQVAIVARAILAAKAEERQGIEALARVEHDACLERAGWVRDATGKLRRIRLVGDVDTEEQNSWVSKANALHSFAAAIRKRGEG